MKNYSVPTIHLEYTEKGYKKDLVLKRDDVMEILGIDYGDKEYEGIKLIFHDLYYKVDEEQL